MDDNYPAVSNLSMCVSSDTLSNVCDCKGDDDLQAYRLNEDKLIAWLKTKVTLKEIIIMKYILLLPNLPSQRLLII